MEILGKKLLILTLALGMLLLGAVYPAFAWEPYKFSGRAEKYVYSVTTQDGESFIYSLDIKPKGDGTFDMSLGYEMSGVEQEDIAAGFFAQPMAFSWMMFLNPLVFGMFGDQEFEVGDRLLIPGGGVIRAEARETVAGIEGILLVFRASTDSLERTEIVVNDDLALPIRTTNYDENEELISEIKLIQYEAE